MGLAKAALRKDAWKLFEAGVSVEDSDLDDYLDRILHLCVEWFGATGASIFLRDGASDRFMLAAQAGSDSNIPSYATITAGLGIAGMSIESGEPLLISDPLRHPLLAGRVNTHHVNLKSSIVVPLLAVGEGGIGVLNLSRNTAAQEFDRSDLKRVAALAQHISLAVSNARLFASLNESRKAEAAARSKLESVVQSLGVAVFVFDSRRRITDSNRKAHELLGTAQVRWQEALDQVSPELTVSLTDALGKAKSSSYVRARVSDQKQDRTWSVVCTPIPGGGTTAVIEETTQHERRHREMARLARLAEIGQMTAAIAHEIRNPLTGIRSAAQIIVSSPEHAAEFGGMIEEEVMKLNDICEEFLEFSRPLQLRRRDFDLYELARRLAERHCDEFAAKGVRLEVEIDGEKPTINADAVRLEQVMLNLMLNAMQACEPGGEVRVTVRKGGFSVTDTGKGMQEADLQKLFTPFFTTKPHGTGLGLCNVRKIVDAHEGKLQVRSKPNSGSVFDIEIGGAA
ncbi:MAG TPA: ATP-binding protein [Fimbriimonadaceae bacterium]|nr:ATP-binding protein [Fimbriimonadaceae bacterium]